MIYDKTNEVIESFKDPTLFCLFEPIGFEEAIQDKRWKYAMDEEIKSIQKNDTWELVNLPIGQKAIHVKWVYKANKNSKGEVEST